MKSPIIILAFLASLPLLGQSHRVKQFSGEGQYSADQGHGYYKNPIFPGNYGDPSIVRIEADYYMTFSRANGVMIWHSQDLVNWRPVIRHRLPEGYNTVWAIDLQYFDGKFHIYMPIREYPNKGNKPFGNFVIRSSSVTGPWSDPIDLEIPIPEGDYSGIDPGFIRTPSGDKYLYVNHGFAMKLDATGTKAVSVPEIVYNGWEFPHDWVVECKCLESPKLFRRGDYYYLISAQGGTSGPSTAHMSVVARARHPLGPWENSPYNPLTHTYSQDEAFWHQGHGTVFEGVDGQWWTVYHGRLRNYTEMGRPTLLMPVEWTADDWPVVNNTYPSWGLIPKPAGKDVGHGMPLSDNFEGQEPAWQWYFANEKANLLDFGKGRLQMTASGDDHREGTEVYNYAANKSYEIQVKVEQAGQDRVAGLRMGYDGIATDGRSVFFTEGPAWRTRRSIYPVDNTDGLWLKIKNYRKDLSFYYSIDGENWTKFSHSLRSHRSYRYSLVSAGSGAVDFKHFTYKGLE